ncbi:MAG: LUD domain-containing protein [Chitinophagaceae bacterium]
MSTLDDIIGNIQANLPAHKVDYPNIPTFEKEGQDLVATFTRRVGNAGGTIFQVNSIAEAQAIAQDKYATAKVICSATDEWQGNKPIDPHTDPRTMEDVDIAIVRSDLGIAEMGMVWLTEQRLKVISLAFLCQHIIVLLEPKKITANMHTAYRQVRLDIDNYGCFVMGPSATADIGAVLIHGAQGPRSLTVFLVEEVNG